MVYIFKLNLYFAFFAVTYCFYRCINEDCHVCPAGGTNCGMFVPRVDLADCQTHCPLYHCKKNGACDLCIGAMCENQMLTQYHDDDCTTPVITLVLGPGCPVELRCPNIVDGLNCHVCTGNSCEAQGTMTFIDCAANIGSCPMARYRCVNPNANVNARCMHCPMPMGMGGGGVCDNVNMVTTYASEADCLDDCVDSGRYQCDPTTGICTECSGPCPPGQTYDNANCDLSCSATYYCDAANAFTCTLCPGQVCPPGTTPSPAADCELLCMPTSPVTHRCFEGGCVECALVDDPTECVHLSNAACLANCGYNCNSVTEMCESCSGGTCHFTGTNAFTDCGVGCPPRVRCTSGTCTPCDAGQSCPLPNYPDMSTCEDICGFVCTLGICVGCTDGTNCIPGLPPTLIDCNSAGCVPDYFCDNGVCTQCVPGNQCPPIACPSCQAYSTLGSCASHCGFNCNTGTGMCFACIDDVNCDYTTNALCMAAPPAGCAAIPDITMGRFYCQCGLMCQPCTPTICLGTMITYGLESDCNQDCQQRFFCSSGVCHVCCGSSCPACATTYQTRTQCDAACVQKYFCSSAGCVGCFENQCPIGALYTAANCDLNCVEKYYCCAGSVDPTDHTSIVVEPTCKPCFGTDCPVSAYQEDDECNDNCKVRYHCDVGTCKTCYGLACSSPVHESYTTCRANCGRFHCGLSGCTECGAGECMGAEPVFHNPTCDVACRGYNCIGDDTNGVCVGCSGTPTEPCQHLDLTTCRMNCGEGTITSLFYCQGMLGCTQCTSDKCIGLADTYPSSTVCNAHCVKKFQCCAGSVSTDVPPITELPTCNACYGNGCSPNAYRLQSECLDNCVRRYHCDVDTCRSCYGTQCKSKVYTSHDRCVENCGSSTTNDLFYCQSGVGCLRCTDLVCLGNIDTFTETECPAHCGIKYYCAAGTCLACTNQCPHDVMLYDDGSSCATDCVAHFFCNAAECQPCYGISCLTPNFGSDATCGGQCFVCSYGEWDQWSRCTALCNGGFKTRSRGVLSGQIADCRDVSQRLGCGQYPCPINCRVSHWGEWTKCIGICGRGRRFRHRALTVPPMFGGVCHISEFVYHKSCDTRKPCMSQINSHISNNRPVE